MGKKRAVSSDAAAGEQNEQAAAAEAKVGAKEVGVYNKQGQHVRTFSAEIHGEKFAKLAEEFAETNGHPTVKKIK